MTYHQQSGSIDVGHPVSLEHVSALLAIPIAIFVGVSNQWFSNGPLTRYVKLRVVHVPGMSGTFPPPHGVTHVPWCMSEWLTRVGRVRVAGSRHFRRMRKSQFYASDKRSMCRYYYWGRYLVMYGWEVMVKLPNLNGSSRHSNTYVLFVVCNVNMLFALQSIYIYVLNITGYILHKTDECIFWHQLILGWNKTYWYHFLLIRYLGHRSFDTVLLTK